MFAAIRERLRHPARRQPEAARLPDAARTSIGFVDDRSRSAGWREPAAAPGRPPAAATAAGRRAPRRWIRWRARCSSWSPRRPATRRTCSTSTSTSRPTSASTPSSRPRSSRRSASAYDIPRDDNLKLRDYPTLRARRSGSCANARRTCRQARLPAGRSQAPAPAGSRRRGWRTWTCAAARCSQLVAEKTGYPPDMLDLDLDLEADLGIDTVKQAEIFAAIREPFDIPRDDNLKLRDYPTLAHVIEFVDERAPAAGAAPPRTRPPTTAAPTPAVRRRRRRPAPAPRPGPGAPARARPLQADRRGARRRARGSCSMPDRGGVAGALAKRLEKLGVEVLAVDGRARRATSSSTRSQAGCEQGRSTASTGCRRSTTRATVELDLAALARGAAASA